MNRLGPFTSGKMPSGNKPALVIVARPSQSISLTASDQLKSMIGINGFEAARPRTQHIKTAVALCAPDCIENAAIVKMRCNYNGIHWLFVQSINLARAIGCKLENCIVIHWQPFPSGNERIKLLARVELHRERKRRRFFRVSVNKSAVCGAAKQTAAQDEHEAEESDAFWPHGLSGLSLALIYRTDVSLPSVSQSSVKRAKTMRLVSSVSSKQPRVPSGSAVSTL